ncbi:hypothetical protein GYH30_030917 [Glycine max]|uniref:Uncharacterized protein n=2 Tax=Glycine subgen. Soja TaxID=1462606 RepID=K7LPJ0_SOYBN|nr:hypothetical protein GYH30_030917 [Glycine max]RZB79732.1 hypothetical protein D0Y65_029809 [Glycine soja]
MGKDSKEIFLSITRQWSTSDKLTLQLPINVRTLAMKAYISSKRNLVICFLLNPDDRPEYASIQAILYGPYLLVGHTIGESSSKFSTLAEANARSVMLEPFDLEWM